MRSYDSNLPLFFIHIPKAAGTSTQKIFSTWFGTGLLKHYYDEYSGTMPQKYDINQIHSPETPVVVYGHFNRLRYFGVEHYYPNAQQFITILRDPLEATISHYFYSKKWASKWVNNTTYHS